MLRRLLSIYNKHSRCSMSSRRSMHSRQTNAGSSNPKRRVGLIG